MLSYEVVVDGERIAIAGMTDWSVMSVIVSATRGDDDRAPDYDLHIGGMSRQTESGAYHARWRAPDLVIGSEILVRVIDCDYPDVPSRKYRSDKDVQENPFTEEEMREMRYQSYLELKSEFES